MAKDQPESEKSADKVRQSAEHEGEAGAKDQTKTVEAYHDLAGAEHSKARPQPGDKSQPSNAGNDGS